MHIYFKENYDSVLMMLENRKFCIFGNTLYAQLFYLYCKEKHLDQNIKAFVLSNIEKDKRKIHIMHGIPVKDLEWLKNTKISYDIFVAAKVKTVQEQLLFLLKKSNCGNLFYVSDFVHLVMRSYFVNLYCMNLINSYMTSPNLFTEGCINISDIGSKNFYKYFLRLNVGDIPDPNIFHGNKMLDELHQQQLGDYYFITGNDKKNTFEGQCRIYIVQSHFDRKLKEEFSVPFSRNIQVGAALTDIVIADWRDNYGDNISEKNRDYCEMTAVYWAWKNDIDSDYIGFCHYRRRFVLDECILNAIISDNYEAIYTVPNLTDGGMRIEFVERNYFLTPEVWDQIGVIIKKVSCDYFDEWIKFQDSYFILPCNMFIMRKDTFNKYCLWVFTILEEMERYYLEQGVVWNNRYLGYISECLTTVYVMKNKDTLKKGYIDMKILNCE